MLEKVLDTESGRHFLRSNHEAIQDAAGLFALEQAEAKLVRAKLGALSPELADRLDQLEDDGRLQVVVSLRRPERIPYLNRLEHASEALKAQSLTISNLKPRVGMETILSRYSGVLSDAAGDFASVISISKQELSQLARDPDIGSVSLYEPPKTGVGAWMATTLIGQSSVNLRVLARSAYSHSQTALPSNLAQGIRAATWESGLNTGFLSCLGITPAAYDPMTVPYFSPAGSNPPGDSVHSLVTFTNLVNAAPGAVFYHRRSWTFQNSADRNFIVNNQLASISLSTNSGGVVANSSENRAVDDIASQNPYPTFSNPTHNAGWMHSPHWAAYNALSVGNVQDSAYLHFKIDTISCGGGSTRTRNPDPVYGGCIDGGTWPNCAGDREMPYLVAPGYTPFGSITPACTESGVIGMTSTCISQGQKWGTSMSAPTVNGMVASLIGRNNYLLYFPEVIRAILLNTARNVHGTLWDQTKDGKDGAGVIHGADAIAFATGLPSVDPGNSAVTKAYYFSQFCESDFTSNLNRTFNVRIPNPKPSGKHLRVVFTWNSFPDLLNGTNELPDLDLIVTTNPGYRFSSSWDANVEIVDVPAGELTAGGTYSITLKPYAWRRTSGAGAQCTFAALTWNFVTTNAR